MATMWDGAVALASKTATQAGKAAEVAATRAKLQADILILDRRIHARKEKFGVEIYAYLQGIASTQQSTFDGQPIDATRSKLVKIVAAYERKRDAMKGKARAARAGRSGTISVFGGAAIGEKVMIAAKCAAARTQEAAAKAELAMVESQINVFKKEFGVALYPMFKDQDNGGWLLADGKARSLYDSAREDISRMEKAREAKRGRMRWLNGAEGIGPTTPRAPVSVQPAPMAVSIAAAGHRGESSGLGGQMPLSPTAPPPSAPPASAVFGTAGGGSCPPLAASDKRSLDPPPSAPPASAVFGTADGGSCPPLTVPDKRPLVEDLLAKYGPGINAVKTKIESNDLYRANASLYDDIWILRFLLNAKGDVPSAVGSALRTMNFRERMNLNALRNVRARAGCGATPCGALDPVVSRFRSHVTDGGHQQYIPDASRGVVEVLVPSMIDQKGIASAMSSDDVLLFYALMFEVHRQILDEVTRQTGRLTKLVMMMDMGGVSVRKMSRPFLKKVAQAYTSLEEHYPEHIGAVILMNAPGFVVRLYDAHLAKALPRSIVDVVSFLPHPHKMSPKHREKFREYLSDEDLPVRFGGKNKVWPLPSPWTKKCEN